MHRVRAGILPNVLVCFHIRAPWCCITEGARSAEFFTLPEGSHVDLQIQGVIVEALVDDWRICRIAALKKNVAATSWLRHRREK